MKSRIIILALCCPLFMLGQDLEVVGQMKIDSMSKVNTADSVVVRLADGTLAVRDVSSLTEMQILSISNDTIYLSGGEFVKLPPDQVDDLDADPSNEKITSLMIMGDSLLIIEGSMILKVSVDSSNSNELQSISRAGGTLMVNLSDGGSFIDSIRSEQDIDLLVAGDIGDSINVVRLELADTTRILSGLIVANTDKTGDLMDSITIHRQVIDRHRDSIQVHRDQLDLLFTTDTSSTNELQTISRSGATVSLSDEGGSYQDSVLSEAQVDAYANNNGYLTSEVDAGWIMDGNIAYTEKNIGIGTTSPNVALEIKGDVRIGSEFRTSSTPLVVENLALTLDANYSDGNCVGGQTDSWQSFKTLSSGNLDIVEVRLLTSLANIGTLTLYEGQGTDGAVLASESYNFPIEGGGLWKSIELTAKPLISADSTYTISMTNVSWVISCDGDQYPDGIPNTGSSDFTFKTFVIQPVEGLVFDSLGQLGIGTSMPDQLLSVNGDASKVGGGSWSTFSDIRLKKDIFSFTDGLNVINQIEPVVFKYNGLADYPNNGKEYVGVIAQDIEKIAPYMVENIYKKMSFSDSEETNLLMYNPSALTYILINAIKEQQGVIANLKIDNEALQDYKNKTQQLELLISSMNQRLIKIENEQLKADNDMLKAEVKRIGALEETLESIKAVMSATVKTEED